MRVVLTGATSFTGYWFARRLSLAGINVVMPIRGRIDEYSGVRGARVAELTNFGHVIPEITFGTPAFCKILSERGLDVLCHHAAEVGNYRSPQYDVLAAASANTLNVRDVVRILADSSAGFVITGSVFEADEGAGDEPRRAFSPYGLSKTLSAKIAEYWCAEHKVPLAKFVIPNPFGIFEEPRFCDFLLRTWRKGEWAKVNTPAYVRDNIHVDLLAMAYVDLVRQLPTSQNVRLSPSGYVETQGAFATRFAREIGGRLGLKADLELADQMTFEEPIVRINTDRPDCARLGWSEREAWDKLALYYESIVVTEGTLRG